jgi:hypothetical protein
MPLIGTWMVAKTGNPLAGLWYPIAIASITFVVGSIGLRETSHVSIWEEVDAPADPATTATAPPGTP